MRLAFAVSTLCLVIGGACHAQEPALRTIPERWHGEWNEDRSACGTDSNDSRLALSADRIEFWESFGLVRGAFTNGPLEILIVADMAGEGLTWLGSSHFRMAGSGDSIAMDTGDGRQFIRYRCPDGPGPSQ
jgi:hypothetical protein